MRSSFRVLALMTLGAAAGVAQVPAGPPMGGGTAASAQRFLARSAELDLTDAQVTRLAGIARRAEARRRTMRSAMDSARTRFTQPGDSLARRAFGQRMQNDMAKERDQSRVDLRDAIAVLTPDQQARAWEMNAARGRPGGAMRGPRPGGMRGGRGMDRPRGMAPGRRPDGMGPGGDMPRDRMAPRGDMGPRGGMRPGRPGRPDADGFPNERDPE
jgi:hypothetical protein